MLAGDKIKKHLLVLTQWKTLCDNCHLTLQACDIVTHRLIFSTLFAPEVFLIILMRSTE